MKKTLDRKLGKIIQSAEYMEQSSKTYIITVDGLKALPICDVSNNEKDKLFPLNYTMHIPNRDKSYGIRDFNDCLTSTQQILYV